MHREYDVKVSVPDREILGHMPSADIFIWQFDNAPQSLRQLSINGGDEDWLVVLAKSLYEAEILSFLDVGPEGIGTCDVTAFDLGNYVMLIGSHA